MGLDCLLLLLTFIYSAALALRIFSGTMPGLSLWHVESSSLARDQTRAPCIGSAVLATGPPEKSPDNSLLWGSVLCIIGCLPARCQYTIYLQLWQMKISLDLAKCPQLRATELERGFAINLKEEVGGIYVGKAFPFEVMTWIKERGREKTKGSRRNQSSRHCWVPAVAANSNQSIQLYLESRFFKNSIRHC